MSSSVDGNYEYNGFISYSHAVDRSLATALQRAVSRFACPWYRLRALRIFRDQTNLSTTPHLWATIQASLDRSEYFILMASPEAKRSEWVSKEIDYWLEKKGGTDK